MQAKKSSSYKLSKHRHPNNIPPLLPPFSSPPSGVIWSYGKSQGLHKTHNSYRIKVNTGVWRCSPAGRSSQRRDSLDSHCAHQVKGQTDGSPRAVDNSPPALGKPSPEPSVFWISQQNQNLRSGQGLRSQGPFPKPANLPNSWRKLIRSKRSNLEVVYQDSFSTQHLESPEVSQSILMSS